MDKLVIAVDGPAGAGKSTIAKAISNRLKIMYIDTGAMYRAVTYNIIKNHIEMEDIESIKNLINNMDLQFVDKIIYLNGEDVTEAIRQPEVNTLVSPVSTIPEVREKLVELQRKMASNNSVVMDGRDIGTNVLKDADFKFFLTASVEERAKRRYLEMTEKGYCVELDSIKCDILNRDRIDSSRKINPLVKAPNAVVIDTTQKSIEAVIDEMLNIIRKR